MRLLILACTVALVSPQIAFGQGISEFGGLGAGTAGLGAGLGASLKNKNPKSAPAKPTVIPTEKEMEKTVATGAKLQSEKKWGDAEECYKTVLRMIFKREGAGSEKSVPTLQQLVTVTKEQGKYKDAIGYQKTIFAFAQRSGSDTKERFTLGKLYLLDGNLQQAESTMRSTLAKVNELPEGERVDAMKTQLEVLQKLNRTDEAKQLEAQISEVAKVSP